MNTSWGHTKHCMIQNSEYIFKPNMQAVIIKKSQLF